MPPENPPPLPPMPPPMPPGGYYAPPPQGGPPPNNYPPNDMPYAPPRNGTPGWVWVLVGCVGCGFVVPVLAAIVFPVFAQARAKARQTSCMSNLKQIATGNLMYVQDYDERFPIASTWQENMMPYTGTMTIFHCPADVLVPNASNSTASSYSFNSALDMMKVKRLGEPQNTVLNYDSTAASLNANDALTSLPSPGRHMKKNNISFADGHAQSWSDSEPLPQGQILPDTP